MRPPSRLSPCSGSGPDPCWLVDFLGFTDLAVQFLTNVYRTDDIEAFETQQLRASTAEVSPRNQNAPRGLRVSEFELRQLDAVRKQLDQEYEAATTRSGPASHPRFSSNSVP